MTRLSGLSTREKLDLVWRLLLWFPLQSSLDVVRCVALAWWRGASLWRYVCCGLCRAFLLCLTPRQIQAISPGDIETYKSWTAQKRVQMHKNQAVLDQVREDIELLPDGASSIMWIGNRRKASKFVLFFHGGGYVAPMLPGHPEWCFQAYVLPGLQGRDHPQAAVAMLQYTLCPGARYPTHLCQATAALSHLLASGVRPRDIVVGGDSAGGNLTAQLLGHLARPHPDASRIVLDEPLAGAFLVSPWLHSSSDSFALENKYIDALSLPIGTNCRHHLLHDTEFDVQKSRGEGWAMPLEVDGAWFRGWDRVAKAVFVTAGAHEILRNHGVRLAEALRKENEGLEVRLDVAPLDAHDFVLMEGLMIASGLRLGGTRNLDEHRSFFLSVCVP